MVQAKGWRRLEDNGVLYVGTQGKMHHGSHGGMPELLPLGTPRESGQSPQDDEAFSAATTKSGCRPAGADLKPMSNFDYAGPLTEILLLGRACPPLAGPAAPVG